MWDREEIKEDQGEFLNCKSQLYDKLWHNVLHCVLCKHKIKDYTLCHSFESCVCISMLITKLSLCISVDSVLQYCSYSMVCPQTTRNESSKKKRKRKKKSFIGAWYHITPISHAWLSWYRKTYRFSMLPTA